MKARYNAGLESELYFFRDYHGLEVDLILNTAFRLHAMEIKASRTLDSSQKKNRLRNLHRYHPMSRL